MKRDRFLTAVLLLVFTFSGISVCAQSQGRGPGPGGFDPDEMVKREKQNLYKSIDDLTDDQKLLLDGIYDEFALSIRELRNEMRQTRDFQAMRPKMMALREEKNGLIKDVLNEEQYEVYLGLMENRRRQIEEYRQRRRDAGDDRPNPPSSDGAPSKDESR